MEGLQYNELPEEIKELVHDCYLESSLPHWEEVLLEELALNVAKYYINNQTK